LLAFAQHFQVQGEGEGINDAVAMLARLWGGKIDNLLLALLGWRRAVLALTLLIFVVGRQINWALILLNGFFEEVCIRKVAFGLQFPFGDELDLWFKWEGLGNIGGAGLMVLRPKPIHT
jgi:hypothetical protein